MQPTLPTAVAAYFRAENARAPTELAACFSDDALVRDEGRDIRGPQAIAAWAIDAARRYDHRIEVIGAAEEDGATLVTTQVSGNFPGSPAQLKFAFRLQDERIAQLEIH